MKELACLLWPDEPCVDVGYLETLVFTSNLYMQLVYVPF